jgi:putative endonuclease
MLNSASNTQLFLDLRDPAATGAGTGTFQTGMLGEESVADALRRTGWRILGHRVRTRWGELDLILRRGDLVVFAEVKTTRTTPAKVQAQLVGSRAQHRLRRAAVAWLAANPRLHRGARRYRFDVFLVRIDGDGGLERIDRIVDAF